MKQFATELEASSSASTSATVPSTSLQSPAAVQSPMIAPEGVKEKRHFLGFAKQKLQIAQRPATASGASPSFVAVAVSSVQTDKDFPVLSKAVLRPQSSPAGSSNGWQNRLENLEVSKFKCHI